MHKNNELMQSPQPLLLFVKSANNNRMLKKMFRKILFRITKHCFNIEGKIITKQYSDQKKFKKAYHLYGLRFAFTLISKQVGQQKFDRHNDIQYISQICKLNTVKHK